MTNAIQSALPWVPVAKDGYAKLDIVLTIGGDIGGFTVRREPPSSEHPGVFIAWHNDVRISDRHHMQRPDAIAEAERYIYALPNFAGAANAKLISAALEFGRQAHRDGANIYQNMFGTDRPIERAQWIEGWLQAFGGMVGAKLINSLTATTQANNQLESDNNYLVAVARTLKIAIVYATEELNKKDCVAFLSEWIVSNEPEAFNEKWPGWASYRVEHQTPPPNEAAN